MAKQAAVETVKLTKSYGGTVAVDKLNLRVEEGEVFGLLGPNGAGKTTTILMLLGLTEPTSGTARVYGHDPAREPLEVKRIAGYLPENVGFYEDLTATENLSYTASLNNLPSKQARDRIKELLDLVGLPDVASKKVGNFSKGMRQRLGIADVLLKNPRLVFLDEPTVGIDPDGVNRILELITKMSKEQNITILLASHLLQQVQMICHRVGIFVKGHLVASGEIDRLARELPGRGRMIIEVQTSDGNPQIVDSIKRVQGVIGVERSGDLLLVNCEKDVRAQISRAVAESNGLLTHLRSREFGLEEIYLRYFREE